jgi:hypothetical protein
MLVETALWQGHAAGLLVLVLLVVVMLLTLLPDVAPASHNLRGILGVELLAGCRALQLVKLARQLGIEADAKAVQETSASGKEEIRLLRRLVADALRQQHRARA